MADSSFAEAVAEQLRGKGAFFAVPSSELIAGEETFDVEFKSTARWNVRERASDAVWYNGRACHPPCPQVHPH